MKITVDAVAAPLAARPDIGQADALCDRVEASLGRAPDFLVIERTAERSLDPLAARIVDRFPGAATLQATSCRGVMTQERLVGYGAPGLGVFALTDADGAYGAAAAPLGDTPRAAAAQAIDAALDAAGRPGETPELVFVRTTPGAEEEILAALSDQLGGHVPLFGGSAADNDVAGGWRAGAGRAFGGDTVGVAALFPSTPVAYSFQSGYVATQKSGIVTAAEGRVIQEIDGTPAAAVYDGWTNGLVTAARTGPSRGVLGATTLAPLGVAVGRISAAGALGAPYFRLIHPEAITGQDGVASFADVAVGERVHLMTGSVESLVTRAGLVAEDALDAAALDVDRVVGGLTIYCAGCMLTVGDEIERARRGVVEALGGAPFLGAHTFGEQGCFLGGENRHGNLMISHLVFTA